MPVVIPGGPKAPTPAPAAAGESPPGQGAASCAWTDPAGHGPSYQLQGVGDEWLEPPHEAVKVSGGGAGVPPVGIQLVEALGVSWVGHSKGLQPRLHLEGPHRSGRGWVVKGAGIREVPPLGVPVASQPRAGKEPLGLYWGMRE